MTFPQHEYIDLPQEMHYLSEYGSATRFKRNILGGRYRLDDVEAAALARGEEITVVVDYGDNSRPVRGKLEGGTFQTDSGVKPYVAFSRTDQLRGVHEPTGTEVTIGEIWGANTEWPGHKWTQEEFAVLLRGEAVGFDAISGQGNSYEALGKLAESEFKGRTTMRFSLLPRDRG